MKPSRCPSWRFSQPILEYFLLNVLQMEFFFYFTPALVVCLSVMLPVSVISLRELTVNGFIYDPHAAAVVSTICEDVWDPYNVIVH